MPDTAAERLWTVQEFLDRYPPPGDSRSWELINGRPTAMAPTSRAHRNIAGNFKEALNARLVRPCKAEQEACIRPLRPKKPDGYYAADVATSCARIGRGTDTPDPVIVAEVLSTDDALDRGDKLTDYRELPTVMAYLLFDQKAPRVEVHQRRSNGAWNDRDYPEIVEGMDALLILSCHGGLSIPMYEVYGDIFG